MSGFFKVDRAIFGNEIWQRPAELRLFLFLIGKARYHREPLQHKGVKLHRGQFLRSYRKLQEDLAYRENGTTKQYPRTTLRRMIQNLIDHERVTVEETNAGTLFTIINYARYQDKFAPEALVQDSFVKNDVSTEERAVLDVLRSIPNWDYNESKDLRKIRELAEEFPKVDMLRSVKEMRDWLEDNPLKKNSNFRLRLRKWISKADEMGVHKTESIPDAENWLRR